MSNETLKIALCQLRTELVLEQTLDKAERMLREAAANGARIVALPEMFSCPYSGRYFHRFAALGHEPILEKLAAWAKENRVVLVGGPAACIRTRIAKAFGLPVVLPPDADVANAVGAALTLPTASLEIYADTSRARLRAPSLDHEEPLGRGFTLEAAKKRAMELLTAHMAASGAQCAQVEVTEADIFATLDDSGRGSHDIRVSCQAVPGIAGRL